MLAELARKAIKIDNKIAAKSALGTLMSSTLVRNVGALGVLQAANYMLPLITLPYLTRVLGTSGYGQLVFAQVLMSYFVLVTDYGFQWSATRSIAQNRKDRTYVSTEFFATWFAQWMLAGLAFIILVCMVLLIPSLREDALLYIGGFTLVTGNVLFPLWLLQGLERLVVVAGIQIASRLVALVLLVIFVKSPSDVVQAILIIGGGANLAGVLSLTWIRWQRLVDVYRPSANDVFGVLRRARALFFSKIAISGYTLLVPTVLGVLVGQSAVGYFNLADKARQAAQGALQPLAQALYPRMSYLFAGFGHGRRRLLKYSFGIALIVSGLMSVVLWLGADWIVSVLGGDEFESAGIVLRWLAPLPFLVAMSNLFGVQIMLPSGRTLAFNTVLSTAAVIGFVLMVPLILWQETVGAAVTLLIVELYVTVAMGIYVWKTGMMREARRGDGS